MYKVTNLFPILVLLSVTVYYRHIPIDSFGYVLSSHDVIVFQKIVPSHHHWLNVLPIGSVQKELSSLQ